MPERALPQTEWLVDPAVAYLNHGGYGALPIPVAAAAARWRAELEANPTDLFTRRWSELLDRSRTAIAAFLNVDAAQTVFVANATAGTATVLGSLDLAAGDEIVTTDHRYPAVASQLTTLGERQDVRVIEAAVPLDFATAAEVVGRVMAHVGPRTRLVVVDHIASPTGLVLPVRELVHAAHAAGVPILIDAAHAPGQLDVDLAATGADFWVGNLHKWVCTPRAVAVLAVAPPWQEKVRPFVASHNFADGFRPAFDWTGTYDPVPTLTIPETLEFWDALGWEAVRRTQHRLVSEGAAHVAETLGTRVAIPDEFTAAMRIAELPQPVTAEESVEIGYRLTTEHKVTAYITEHEGSSYVRMCGQLYNVPEHYERLATGLRALLLR